MVLILAGSPMQALAEATNEWSVSFNFSGNGSQQGSVNSVGGYQQIQTQATQSSTPTGDQVYYSVDTSGAATVDSTFSTSTSPSSASNTIKLNEVRNSGLIYPKVVIEKSSSVYLQQGQASTYFESLAFKPTPEGSGGPFTLSVNGTQSLASDGSYSGQGSSELRIWAWTVNPLWNNTPNDYSDDTIWWADQNNDGTLEAVVSATTLYIANLYSNNSFQKNTPYANTYNFNPTYTFQMPLGWENDYNFWIRVGFSVSTSLNEYDADFTPPITTTPEPTTLLLLGLGVAGLAGVRRFRK
jgi:PEP-CTERM motif